MTTSPIPNDEPAAGEVPASGNELAALLRRWRRGGADEGRYLFTAARAAEMLGIPLRTYQNIEQGRGFAYPRLIVLALMAFGDAP